jgi:hypothetical protein
MGESMPEMTAGAAALLTVLFLFMIIAAFAAGYAVGLNASEHLPDIDWIEPTKSYICSGCHAESPSSGDIKHRSNCPHAPQ